MQILLNKLDFKASKFEVVLLLQMEVKEFLADQLHLGQNLLKMDFTRKLF